MSEETTSKKLNTKDILMQLLFLGIGIALFVFVLKKFDLDDILTTLKSAKVAPIIAVVFISILGHVFRAWRWQLLMNYTGKSNFWNLLFSLQLGYFVSLAIPRIGEFIKCFTSAETEKKPVSYIFGTIMSERFVDLIVFAILTIVALAFYGDFVLDFWTTLKSNFTEGSSSSKYFMIGGLILVFVIIYPMINKMSDGEKNEIQLMEGMKSSILIKEKGLFLFSTVMIWVCYFLTSYILFFSFDGTSNLGFKDGFLAMEGGTLSRMLPINGGGIGAFHFVIENLLTSLGVEGKTSIAYAILNHGIQFFFQIVVGIIAIIFLSRKINLSKISLKI